jgi:hypothetical protein
MVSKTAEKYKLQVKGHSELEWVHLSKMKVNPAAQREFNAAWANQIFSEFDPDKMQTPHVNQREGHYFIMDGQHTIDALKRFLGKWDDQTIQCRVYKGLNDTEEAEMYLSLNNRKSADTFQKFRIALRAGREIETSIKDIVLSEGLVISKEKVKGQVRCVGTLKKVFKRDGSDSLGRALGIVRDSWGDAGLEAPVIDGFGLLCHRYNGNLNSNAAIESLRAMHGGVKGLIGSAETLRLRTGNSKNDCIAAAAVAIINRARTGKAKLPTWWKE